MITYGREYSGPAIGEGTAKAGMEQPAHYWVPSIAPSGMAFHSGHGYPAWKGQLFVGALAATQLVRLVVEPDGKVVHEERIGIGKRVRDVREGPDGALYLVTDEDAGEILRVVPARYEPVDRTERFYRIRQRLVEKGSLTRREIEEDLEISHATFKRDIEYLRDRLNVPIVWSREQSAYVLDPKAEQSELPGVWFSPAEVYALLEIDHLLGSLGGGHFRRQLEPLRARLAALLESGDHGHREIRRRIRVLALGTRRVNRDVFEALSLALLGRKQAFIRHLKRGDGDVTERTVSPQRLVHYRYNWYLDAWCHVRKDLRTFAVDAIRHRAGRGIGRARSAGCRARPRARRRLRNLLGRRHRNRGAALHAGQRALGGGRGLALAAGRAHRGGRQLRARAAVQPRARAGDGPPAARLGRRSAGAARVARARRERAGRRRPPVRVTHARACDRAVPPASRTDARPGES